MKGTAYLVNVTRDGRHTALASTHDAEFLNDLQFLRTIGYELEVTVTPSPIKGTNGKTLTP